MGDIPVQELVALALSLVVAGMAVGLLAGLFGVGGGAVVVPVLYQVLLIQGIDESVRMHVAIGSSLGVIVPTAISSFRAHRRRGGVDMALLKSWAVWIVIGVFGGSVVAGFVNGEQMKIIFSVLIAAVGIRLIVGTGGRQLGDHWPGQPVTAISGLLIGASSSLMGIGGGILATTAQTLYNRPLIKAIATSSGVGVLIAIPGVVGFVLAGWDEPGLPPLSLGYVNVPAVVLMIPLSMLTAPAGAALAHRLGKRTLELSFGIFVLIISSRFLVPLVF